jgi:ketosteroid isomerase-like protein
MYVVVTLRKALAFCFIVAFVTIAVAQEPAASNSTAGPIRTADEEFAQETKQNGLEGWLSFFADDAYVGMKPSVEGKLNLRQYYRGLFARRDIALDWTPERAEMFKSGIVGYSSGKYTLSFTNYQGTPVKETGTYLTVWQKQPDGKWKVLAHFSNLDTPANAVPQQTAPATTPPVP